jgi:uncharacterized protein
LNCRYCFGQRNTGDELDLTLIFDFINMIINAFPKAEKFIVDPTGSGEPLLRLEELCKIGRFCLDKSNEIGKELLPMIVTNGVLLNKDTAKVLRESNVLFGVSLDGNKVMHDSNRVDFNSNGTYSTIYKNVKAIANRSLLGAAVTLNDKNLNFVKILKSLTKLFPTISMKVVRDKTGLVGLNSNNIGKFVNQYSKLTDFLIKEIKKGNVHYIAALLNGDDYFGKFVLRVMINQRVSSRCDAGQGRFSLYNDGLIYACPGAIGINDLVVGNMNTGIDYNVVKKIYNVQNENSSCDNCIAKFVCGGVCMIQSFYDDGTLNHTDKIMCKLNNHIFKEALRFKAFLLNTRFYNVVLKGCYEKASRFKGDKRITDLLSKQSDYSFIELKNMKYDDANKFKSLVDEYCDDEM